MRRFRILGTYSGQASRRLIYRWIERGSGFHHIDHYFKLESGAALSIFNSKDYWLWYNDIIRPIDLDTVKHRWERYI